MNHNSKIEAEIVACEQQLYTAQISSNVSLLQELLSDELVFVGPSGEIFTKQMDLELHRSGSINITKLEPKEQEIRCLNGAAVTVTKIFLAGTFQGASFAGMRSRAGIIQRPSPLDPDVRLSSHLAPDSIRQCLLLMCK